MRKLQGPDYTDEDRPLVEAYYREIFDDWQQGIHLGHNEYAELELEFRKTFAPISGIMDRIRDALTARSIRSTQDLDVLRAFERLSFAKHFEQAIRYHPFRTIAGLEDVLVLLREANRKHRAKAPEKPRAGDLNAKALNDAQTQKMSKSKRKLRYDPKLLRSKMERLHHTNKDVMDFFHLTQESTVSRWRSGQMNMSPDNARRYIEYMGLPEPETPR